MKNKTSNLKASKNTEKWLQKAGVLTQALPFMHRYYNKVVVIKYGGSAMVNETLAAAFAEDLVLLKQCGVHPVIVHGGGWQIGSMLERLGIKSEFVDGLRVTDETTVEIVEMVLSGKINKSIVAAIQTAGGYALGLSGKDCRLIEARKSPRTRIQEQTSIDLGFVGVPTHIDTYLITEVITATDIIPVIAPLGFGAQGETYNINADTAAGALAEALSAERLILLTDVAGVLDDDNNLLTDLSVQKCQELLDNGTLQGGMIPKIETCIKAIQNGVSAAVVIDGRTQHAILMEIFTTQGAGTLIR